MRAVWAFIAGDSRLAPFGVALAVSVALLLVRYVPGSSAWAGPLYMALIAAGLVAGVFERT